MQAVRRARKMAKLDKLINEAIGRAAELSVHKNPKVNYCWQKAIEALSNASFKIRVAVESESM